MVSCKLQSPRNVDCDVRSCNTPNCDFMIPCRLFGNCLKFMGVVTSRNQPHAAAFLLTTIHECHIVEQMWPGQWHWSSTVLSLTLINRSAHPLSYVTRVSIDLPNLIRERPSKSWRSDQKCFNFVEVFTAYSLPIYRFSVLERRHRHFQGLMKVYVPIRAWNIHWKFAWRFVVFIFTDYNFKFYLPAIMPRLVP